MRINALKKSATLTTFYPVAVSNPSRSANTALEKMSGIFFDKLRKPIIHLK